MEDSRSPSVKAVAIGASAGALDALDRILPFLPKNFAPPIFVVVHIPPDGESMLSPLLQDRCRLAVREARDKEPIAASTVYLAPPDYHLLVEKNGLLSLSNEEPVLFSRPSINVLFESAADAYGNGLVGIVLTGANQDGALGLRKIIDRGGTGILQSPVEAYASAMPQAALDLCPEAWALDLGQIAGLLKKFAAK